jgi:acyl carrier protein
MSRASVEIVRDFIAQNFYVPEDVALSEDVSLIEHGIVDSTGVLEVTAFLESEFGIRVADAEIVAGNMETIARIAAFVDRKTAQAGQAA